ncbi:Benzoyl-CoA reductase subunit D, partial [Frankliniella fusca]
IASDDIHQYPVLGSSVDLWKDYSKILLDIIKLDRPKYCLKPSASDDENFVSLILEVPKLFKVKTISKSSEAAKKSTCMRPSQLEINRGFCIHVNTISEVNEALAERKKLLEKYKFPNQPVPIFLGPIQTLQQYFIAFEDYRWEVDGPMQAFFGAFSVIFGLDSTYPAEAKHLWIFLQHTLFKIEATDEFKKDRGLNLLGDRAGVLPGTPQPRAVYIGQAAIGGGDGESAARRPHLSASAQRCNQARSVLGDGSRLQEGSGRSVTVRSPETTADGCRISGGPGLDETPLQAVEGPGQLQRWGSEPGSVARTEGGGAWEADDRGWHGSALRSELSREETLKSVQRAASLFWQALSPTQKGVIKGLMERLYAPCEDKNLFKDLIKHCIE